MKTKYTNRVIINVVLFIGLFKVKYIKQNDVRLAHIVKKRYR